MKKCTIFIIIFVIFYLFQYSGVFATPVPPIPNSNVLVVIKDRDGKLVRNPEISVKYYAKNSYYDYVYNNNQFINNEQANPDLIGLPLELMINNGENEGKCEIIIQNNHVKAVIKFTNNDFKMSDLFFRPVKKQFEYFFAYLQTPNEGKENLTRLYSQPETGFVKVVTLQ
jgi:hypothetical protein